MRIQTGHPLQAWLERHDESVVEFAKRTDQAFAAIYSLIQGRTRNLSATMLAKIQTATGGEVSINEMIEWTRNNALRKTA